MSIQFGDILKHNNLVYPIVDINDVKGGLRSIATFSSPALVSEYASIPEKYRSGYSLLLETSTGTIYYLAGNDATNVSHWSPVGIGGNGTGVANAIPKWTSSSILGNSNITDNGDIVTINGNLQVIGTTSTISSENLLVKDPIILLAGSQSGLPTYDAGLFINRGSSNTQAFIWDESEKEFKFISTTSSATTSGNVSIGTYSSVRTGVLRVGTQSVDSNDRFVVSSLSGTVSLVVDEEGSVYNKSKGIMNTLFGYESQKMGLSSAIYITRINSGDYNYTDGIYTNVQMTLYSGPALSTYPIVDIEVSFGEIINVTIVSNGSGFTSNTTQLTASIPDGTGFYVIIDELHTLNTSIGYKSLYNNIGNKNTTLGAYTLYSNTSGYENTSIGYQSLYSNTSGYYNIGIGSLSLYSNTYGISNIAIGQFTLEDNTSGNSNIAIGVSSLKSNTIGFSNVAIGSNALSINTTGLSNVAIGTSTMFSNTSGNYNTAIGFSALQLNSTGVDNVAIGWSALQYNSTGIGNVGIGRMSLLYNTTGSYNTAVGWQSLPRNTTSDGNTVVGRNVMFYSKTGSANTAVGDAVLYHNTLGNGNTSFGSYAGHFNTTGVATIGTFSSGNGYTPGTYSGVQLKYSSGTFLDGTLANYPLATIIIGTGGTVSSVTLETTGQVFQNTSTIMTSKASEIGPGVGFTVQINTIQTANNNTTIGSNSLYYNTIGSNNTSLGFQAGSYTTIGNNNISDNSIFIGYNSKAQYTNQTNQIVIGYDAVGNGSNSVTLGNDNITKTILKGNVGIGLTGPNCALEINGHKTYTLPITPGTSGEVVYFGNTSGLTQGKIYVFDKNLFDGTEWKEADNTSLGSGLLAIALGTSSSDGMLLRGYVSFTDVPYVDMADYGNIQYLSVSGEFTEVVPTVSGEIVRVIGYCLSKSNSTPVLYFCPDTTWIELSLFIKE